MDVLGKYHYIVISNFGHEYSSSDGSYELQYECPKCKDLGKRYDDRKLYVNTENLLFNCFRCGWKGRVSGSETQDTTPGNASRLYNMMIDYLETSAVSDRDDDVTYYKLPSIVPSRSDPATRYLLSRGFTYDDVIKYNIRVSGANDYTQYHGRLVVPNRVIGNEWTDMYVARTYIDQVPKYKNPFDSPKSRVVFNLHNLDHSCEQIIVCEGALTAIMAGHDAVATYGKNLSDEQSKMIVSKHPKRIYLCYDYDLPDGGYRDVTQYKVDDAMYKLLSDINTAGRLDGVDIELYWIVMPPNMDAVDVGRDVFRSVFLENAIRVVGYSEYKVISKLVGDHNVVHR